VHQTQLARAQRPMHMVVLRSSAADVEELGRRVTERETDACDAVMQVYTQV